MDINGTDSRGVRVQEICRSGNTDDMTKCRVQLLGVRSLLAYPTICMRSWIHCRHLPEQPLKVRRLEIFGIEPRMDFATEVKVTRAIPYTVFLSLLQ